MKHKVNRDHPQVVVDYLEKELLLPIEVLDVSAVYKMGAEKYAPWDWLNNPNSFAGTSRFGSFVRHLLKWFYGGEKIDEESGLSHLLHLEANAQMQRINYEKGKR